MKKVKNVLLVLLVVILGISTSCTENQRAKRWGGTAGVTLEEGQKVVTVTWKDSDLWILTRDRKAGESVDTYTFFEESSWGVLEGSYIIKEK